MSDVFISYSRKDIAFAKLIREALQASDLDTWIDWERIPIGENWWKEICEAIENANVFMFIISRNSIGSAVCRDEINQALRNHKRIIPIIVDNLSPAAVKDFAPDLPQINWIAFEQDHNFQISENPEVVSDKPEDRLVALPRLPQFQDALARLSKAIHLDWEWVKYHTSLQVESRRWETLNRNPDYLLRGAALETAEARLLSASRKDPAPSVIQIEFITSSRQEESHRQQVELRQQEEKLRLEQKARARQRLASWAIGIGLVIAIILGTFGWTQRNQYLNESQIRATSQFVAEEQRDIATARQLAAQSGMRLADRLDVSLLLAVQSSKIKDTSEGRTSLAAGLQAHPELRKVLHSETNQHLLHMAISPDSRWIAAGGNASLVTIWDTATFQPLKEPLNGLKGWVNGLVFSSDSKVLIAKDTDGLIQFWDTSNWKLTLQFQEKAIIQILPHPGNSKQYITRETGGIIAVREFSNNKPINKISTCNSSEGATNIAIQSSGQKFAVTCGKSSVQVWDLASGKSISNLVPLSLGSINDLAFNPAGNLLAFSGQSGFLDLYSGIFWLWDIDKFPLQPETLQNPLKHGDNCGEIFLAFNPNGLQLASGCGKTVKLWSTSAKIALGKPLSGTEANITSLEYFQDGKNLVASGNYNHLFVWNPEERLSSIKSEVKVQNWPALLAFTTSGEKNILVDAGCGKLADKGNDCIEGEISLTPLTTSDPVREPLAGSFPEVKLLSTHPNSLWLASGHSDGAVNLWDLPARKLAYSQLESPDFSVKGLDISADNHWLVAGGQDGKLHLWDLSQTPPAMLELRKGQKDGTLSNNIFGLKISPSAQVLVEVGSYITGKALVSKVLVWDLKSRTVKFEIPYKATFFQNGRAPLAISPDNKRLALALYTDILLYDLSSGIAIPSPTKPVTSQILSIAFSPNGKWIASGGSDKTVTFWDAESLQVITQLGSVGYSVNSLAISPDGKTIANTGDLASIPIWDVSLSSWQAAACQIANRNLSQAEWQNYLPNFPYEKTCPDHP